MILSDFILEPICFLKKLHLFGFKESWEWRGCNSAPLLIQNKLQCILCREDKEKLHYLGVWSSAVCKTDELQRN